MDGEPGARETLALRSERLAACLERARAGERGALHLVVSELNPVLWSVARAQGLVAEDAADVVQTTWLELVRQLDRIHTPMALVGWLIRATKREAWRANARRRKYAMPGIEVVEDRANHEPGPEERLVVGERHRVLWRHFAKLPERCQALLRVAAEAGRPNYEAISEALGMPHGSIGPTRGRCLAKLRAMLLADPEWQAA